MNLCRRCFPCTRNLVDLFLSQSADIVMAADYDGFPDFWKEPWFPPVCPCPPPAPPPPYPLHPNPPHPAAAAGLCA